MSQTGLKIMKIGEDCHTGNWGQHRMPGALREVGNLESCLRFQHWYIGGLLHIFWFVCACSCVHVCSCVDGYMRTHICEDQRRTLALGSNALSTLSLLRQALLLVWNCQVG